MYCRLYINCRGHIGNAQRGTVTVPSKHLLKLRKKEHLNKALKSQFLKKMCTLYRARIFKLLKVVGNEKNGGSGRSQMLGYGVGPWRSMFIYNLNMQF
jgi:hypothetical protein